MVNVEFEDAYVEGLKQAICRSDEGLIDDALDLLVQEVFEASDSNKDEGLTF